MSEQRLIDLEMKFAHQEIAIERLQTELFEQAKVIEALQKTVSVLRERLKAEISGEHQVGPAGQKPPHY